MKRKFVFLISLCVLGGLFSISTFGQKATGFEIKTGAESGFYGALIITVSGKKRKIAEEASDVWILNNGKEVVYSVNDRNRGFEAEGQSLKIYDVATRKTRNILSEYTVIVGVTETKLSNGVRVLLVSLVDGGLGGSYFAVVDPKRGQVLSLDFAELLEIKGDTINLAIYGEGDWEAINQKRDWESKKSESAFAKPTKVKPQETKTLDLKEILKNKVIYNKTNEELANDYRGKYSDLTIYMWRPDDKYKDQEYVLIGYVKQFPKTMSPLRTALEKLFSEVSEADKKDGWASATLGMKFEGVVLKEGIATIKFSQSKEKHKMVGFAGKLFVEAVEKTAKQFNTVKEVKICQVGGEFPAFENIPQITKCQ